MRPTTYLSVLTRAHLREFVPLPKEELLALKRNIGELGSIGRNINQIAKAANEGGRLPSAVREEFRQACATGTLIMTVARFGRGLYEIRSDLTSRRIARVIFSVAGARMVLLHGFIKKAQKTPKADLDLAMKRKKEIS
jgi:phage-related protein